LTTVQAQQRKGRDVSVVDTTLLPWELVVPNPRGGDVFRKVIRTAEGGRQVSYDVRLERFGEGDRAYSSIRHRHDFEQLRFAASGRMDLGFAVLEEGDVGYFPANAYYGPQTCEGAVVLIVQWGDRFLTKEQNDAAVAELSERGEFVDGIYRGVDERGKPFNKDPLNAIWEQVFGEPYVPRTPRYRQPVLMTPHAFGWRDGQGPVQIRHLGQFGEFGLEVETVRWAKDGVATLKSADDERPSLLFTSQGSFSVAGDGESVRGFGPQTGVWADPAESLDVTATGGSEALHVRFPPPSAKLTL
jgi:hypothetical protein